MTIELLRHSVANVFVDDWLKTYFSEGYIVQSIPTSALMYCCLSK
jgi:hypothetical protein